MINQEEESVDTEALYIGELAEKWSNINLITPKSFKNTKNINSNQEWDVEFWAKTFAKNEEIHWLADTGSTSYFMNIDKEKELRKKQKKNAQIPEYNESNK